MLASDPAGARDAPIAHTKSRASNRHVILWWGGDRGGHSSRAAASAGSAPPSCAPASAPASEPASGVPPSNASMQGPSSSLTQRRFGSSIDVQSTWHSDSAWPHVRTGGAGGEPHGSSWLPQPITTCGVSAIAHHASQRIVSDTNGRCCDPMPAFEQTADRRRRWVIASDHVQRASAT
jgi:hypothetical protein